MNYSLEDITQIVNQKLRDYETSYSTASSVSGLYSPSDKTIFVDREGTIPHEMGHYIYFLLEIHTIIIVI